jgi:hypothetical protein
VGASPGARVTFDKCVLRRLAGVSGVRTLADLQTYPRPTAQPPPPSTNRSRMGVSKSGSGQVAFVLPQYCYNTTRPGQAGTTTQACGVDAVRGLRPGRRRGRACASRAA